jgi:hypothetical protein
MYCLNVTLMSNSNLFVCFLRQGPASTVAVGFELKNLPPECWDYRCVPPHLSLIGILNMSNTKHLLLAIHFPLAPRTCSFPVQFTALSQNLWVAIHSSLSHISYIWSKNPKALLTLATKQSICDHFSVVPLLLCWSKLPSPLTWIPNWFPCFHGCPSTAPGSVLS